MDLTNAFLKQLQSNRTAIFLILTISASFIALVILLHFLVGASVGDLTRDPIAILKGKIYHGFLSQTGIFFWAATAGICLFTSYALDNSREFPKVKIYLVTSGCLSLLLGIDDIFLLHEQFFPQLGIDQKIVIFCYGILTLTWLIYFSAEIFKTDFILLGIAFIFFGISVAFDAINPSIRSPQFYEDGAKFVGLTSWMIYFFKASLFALQHSTVRRFDSR